MKTIPAFSTRRPHAFLRCNKFQTLLVLAAACLGVCQTWGANLLVNSSFEQNSGHALPTGWTRFAPPTAQTFGNYWIEGSVTPQSGVLYYKEWGASYGAQPTNTAGIYQDLSSAPGSVYQASGWMYSNSGDGGGLGPDCYVWIQVEFYGSTSNLLALFTSGQYNAGAGLDTWFQYQVTNACDISQPLSINDPYFNTYAVTGSVSQIVAPLGTVNVRYRFCYTQINAEGGSCYFDSADLDQISGPIPPTISSVFPLNMIFVNPGDGMSFTVSSPSGHTIDNSAIGLVVNGANVSAGLNISGSTSTKTVTYHGLQSNTVYHASITVTDSFNLTASANSYFETTWVGVPPIAGIWEAEDFDFTNGMYYDNPALCATIGMPNCYFGTVGVEGTDEHFVGTAPTHAYRPDDAVGTVIAGDYARPDHYLAGVFDYRIDPFVQTAWLNYTRDWTNGTYWVIGRLSTDIGLSGSLTLSVVNPDTTVTDLGTFTINGGLGWSTFENVYLLDTNGNPVNVTLNGKMTLRVTSGGNLLPNFFMLTPAQIDLPILSHLYPNGSQPFQYTNALSFTVTTVGATFPTSGIKVILDGVDVSSRLSITGSSSSNNVVYAGLLPNAVHNAVITVTNSLGHGLYISNKFDTFTEDNYMFEAEDYDYNGGQYIDPWSPDAYLGFGATTNIDFQHSPIDGEQFPYRLDGIPEEISAGPGKDYLRQVFANNFGIDYHLAWYGPGDWSDYTRNFPSGKFYVYNRTAGLGAFSMYLDRIVSGAGTVNQTTSRLGQFTGVGTGNQNHDWVQLLDAGGAPVVVNLGGTNTVRLTTTTGDCYPSYLMLVPANGIRLTAIRSGNSVVVSFPTQAGVLYRVLYSSNVTGGNWALLTTIAGDGTVKSATDNSSAAQRFYKVVAP
ncbi:MAG TPA: hypothetical protein VG167_22915 [Verrucomicrobiae bacterium]|nr:hypothetical protein [Verrucomicrobiae bacterium]